MQVDFVNDRRAVAARLGSPPRAAAVIGVRERLNALPSALHY